MKYMFGDPPKSGWLKRLRMGEHGYVAVEDDCVVWGLGDTPTGARHDAKESLDSHPPSTDQKLPNIKSLKILPCTQELFNKIKYYDVNCCVVEYGVAFYDWELTPKAWASDLAYFMTPEASDCDWIDLRRKIIECMAISGAEGNKNVLIESNTDNKKIQSPQLVKWKINGNSLELSHNIFDALNESDNFIKSNFLHDFLLNREIGEKIKSLGEIIYGKLWLEKISEIMEISPNILDLLVKGRYPGTINYKYIERISRRIPRILYLDHVLSSEAHEYISHLTSYRYRLSDRFSNIEIRNFSR